MEKISGIDQCFNVIIANAETKKVDRNFFEKEFIDMFNNYIIPTINEGNFHCDYSVEYGYVDIRIIEKLKDLGYQVYTLDNAQRISIYWTTTAKL